MTATEMDFAAFVEWRNRCHAAAPHLRDYAETRIARAFASLRPTPTAIKSGATVHRCDLARRWCDLRGVPQATRRALVCLGVRHALALLFASFARAGRRVALPGDVYPVYWRLAADAGMDAVRTETFPIFAASAVFEVARRARATGVLLPYPLKLHGRAWTSADLAAARAWLFEAEDHRLLLDGVYSFGRSLTDDLVALLETDRVYYLDSLSKGWLHEQVFGAAIVPSQDLGEHIDPFRGSGPPPELLRLAEALLFAFEGFPERLVADIDARRAALARDLRADGLHVNEASNGYLLAVRGDAREILERHATLTIPASAFGAIGCPWSLASALRAIST